MATSSKIKIMISSRCDDRFPPGASNPTLTDIRRDLKTEIEAVEIFGKKAFEVWINEETPPKGGTWDSWDVCLRAVTDCDILLVLSNGHAGGAKALGDIGMCHAELMAGLTQSPGKVWYISLGNSASGDAAQIERNRRFQEYTRTQSLFRGASVRTIAELKSRVMEALHDAIVTLTRKGVRESSRGKFHSGEALNWSRLDFAERQRQMIRIVRNALNVRPAAVDIDPIGVVVQISGSPILFRPTAIPAAFTVTAAREMVGQPFLRDHENYADLSRNKAMGPVHLIACQKSVSEAQALRLLGFPDATVVAAPFGVYVADDIQKIQMILVANCRDETTTRHGVQRIFEWLEQTDECERLAQRAASRTKIIKTISQERASEPASLPTGHAKSPAKQKTLTPLRTRSRRGRR